MPFFVLSHHFLFHFEVHGSRPLLKQLLLVHNLDLVFDEAGVVSLDLYFDSNWRCLLELREICCALFQLLQILDVRLSQTLRRQILLLN